MEKTTPMKVSMAELMVPMAIFAAAPKSSATRKYHRSWRSTEPQRAFSS